MKKCPFCAEEIRDEAILCKHCRSDLTTKVPAAKPIPNLKEILGIIFSLGVLLICTKVVLNNIFLSSKKAKDYKDSLDIDVDRKKKNINLSEMKSLVDIESARFQREEEESQKREKEIQTNSKARNACIKEAEIEKEVKFMVECGLQGKDYSKDNHDHCYIPQRLRDQVDRKYNDAVTQCYMKYPLK